MIFAQVSVAQERYHCRGFSEPERVTYIPLGQHSVVPAKYRYITDYFHVFRNGYSILLGDARI